MTDINWHSNGLPDEAQQWRRQVEEAVARLVTQEAQARTNGIAASQERAGLAAAISRSGLALAEQGAAVKEGRRAPAAPENPQVTTDAYFDEYGVPRASVNASCDTVTVDTLGTPIAVQFYELYGRRDVPGDVWQKLSEDWDATSAPSMTYAGLPAGEDWAFKMRAVAGNGVQGEFSGQVTVTLAKDTTPPPKPAPPAGSTRLGQTSLFWSGLTAGGQTQPPDFSHAEVWIASTPTAAGSAIGRMGVADTFYPEMQPYNVARWYWVIAVDVAGNRSMASDRISVTTKPLVDTDVIGEVISGANIVTGSINAADKIIGNTITGGLIQALAIDAGKLAANAVTTDKLDAGAVTAVKVAANAITTEKMTIGNFEMLAPPPGSPEWSLNGLVWPAWGGALGGVALWTKGDVGFRLARGFIFDVKPGERINVEGVWANTGDGTTVGGVYVGVEYQKESDGTWGRVDAQASTATSPLAAFSGVATIPTGTNGKARVAVYVYPASGTPDPTKYAVVHSIIARRMTTGSLIVDGAIDGKTITGALIRSAASGERTEMTNQGVRQLNSSGQETVRIGYGIPTGMAVRNPHTGTLVPLSDAAFGTASVARTDNLTYTAPYTSGDFNWGGWTRHSGDTCAVTFTAVASRYMVDFGETWTVTQTTGSTHRYAYVYVNPRLNGTQILASGVPYSVVTPELYSQKDQGNSSLAFLRVQSARGAVVVNTTPGSTYTVDMMLSTMASSSTSGGVPLTLNNRYITATPVFN